MCGHYLPYLGKVSLHAPMLQSWNLIVRSQRPLNKSPLHGVPDKWSFSFCLNTSREGEPVISWGRSFYFSLIARKFHPTRSLNVLFLVLILHSGVKQKKPDPFSIGQPFKYLTASRDLWCYVYVLSLQWYGQAMEQLSTLPPFILWFSCPCPLINSS